MKKILSLLLTTPLFIVGCNKATTNTNDEETILRNAETEIAKSKQMINSIQYKSFNSHVKMMQHKTEWMKKDDYQDLMRQYLMLETTLEHFEIKKDDSEWISKKVELKMQKDIIKNIIDEPCVSLTPIGGENKYIEIIWEEERVNLGVWATNIGFHGSNENYKTGREIYEFWLGEHEFYNYSTYFYKDFNENDYDGLRREKMIGVLYEEWQCKTL